MLNSNQQAEFNPAGRNGIIQFDQNLDNVSIYKITPWTAGTSEAQHWVDIHYALLELARERQYDLMMDVFTFTSLHDGCPNTVLEAMLAGTPIVATRAGAVPELIENGKHGLLVQPGSATGLCEALLRMLATNTDRQQYGKQAQQRVLTAFAPQKELESYWKVYLECLSSK